MLYITTFAEANKALERYWPQRLPSRPRGPEQMQRLMSFLGNPQDTLKVIHVAGTSGKTSTAYYTAALLHEAGAKVGLVTSPHLYEVNERVQLDMVPLEEKAFCSGLAQFLDLIEHCGFVPNYFEVIIAFAYWEFARSGVTYAVIETGMGGLLDVTNVATRADKVCIVTDIGLDHTHILGDTLPEIAAHKAGIIHWHNLVFCHRQIPEVMEVIRARARQKQADLHILDDQHVPFDDTFLPLFQQRNFSLAYAAACAVLARDDTPLTLAMITRAAHAHIPGRMQTMHIGNKTVVLDAAHNPQKLRMCVASMRERYSGIPIAVLLGTAPGLWRGANNLAELAGLAEHVILTQFGDASSPFLSMRGPELLAAAKSAHLSSYELQETIQEGVRTLLKRPEPVLLITGSVYLLAQAQRQLEAA